MTRGWVPTPPPKTGGLTAAKHWLAARLKPATDRTHQPSEPAPALVATAVAKHVPVASANQAASSMQHLLDDLLGLGPLAVFARNATTTDIIVDGHGRVWTDTGAGLNRTETVLDAETTRALAVRLLGQGGKRLDEGMPFGDVQIGSARVHAVLPPIATAGPQLSIRLPSRTQPTIEALATDWPGADKWLNVLHHLMHHRANILISGATGSGKTTLLAALLATVDPDQRILTIEDTPELDIRHPHVVGLATREPNTEGQGGIGLPILIRQALRMRPDRVIVGECRGAEVAEFLSAMNTGHRGAIGTVHANSASDVPARLNAMAALAGLDPATAAAQIRSAIDVVLHLERNEQGQRYPAEAALLSKASEDTNLPLMSVLTTVSQQVIEGPGLALLDGLAHQEAA
ncbi:TadA family conjugal transfer-associated ATPase [Enteractinococcus coprophilus]|uniref:Pilus assembly protein CpaF n=1 Tax=Enteractinococcus coprophilus TaxID=1027633 RepID=A0A543AM65_9MICC|nr:TadA family conjugal transfer-associated ATPase [Enteractinococcus coprophilus]TQL73652.1 pilus assembly protein CpaF [Enteractinococcus coprophilus]